MTVIVTACPKSGSHAVCALLSRMGLQRIPGTILANTPDQVPHVAGVEALSLDAIRLLPDSVYAQGHVCADHAQALDGMPVITVLRDPRNVLISYCRHRLNTEGKRVTIAEAIDDFWGAPFPDVYRGYLPWRGRAAVFRYEDLPGEVVGDGAGVYCIHDWAYNTRTGKPSNYVEDWSTEDWRAWRAAGGSELLTEVGYT